MDKHQINVCRLEQCEGRIQRRHRCGRCSGIHTRHDIGARAAYSRRWRFIARCERQAQRNGIVHASMPGCGTPLRPPGTLVVTKYSSRGTRDAWRPDQRNTTDATNFPSFGFEPAKSAGTFADATLVLIDVGGVDVPISAPRALKPGHVGCRAVWDTLRRECRVGYPIENAVATADSATASGYCHVPRPINGMRTDPDNPRMGTVG